MIYIIIYGIIALLLAFIPAYKIFPRFIRKMKKLGKVGIDVNKRSRNKVAEMGGVVCLFSFSISMFIVAGMASVLNIYEEIVTPLQTAVGVFFAAAIVGFIDDLGLLTRRRKAILVGFAAIPLIFTRPTSPEIILPFITIEFTGLKFFNFDILYLLFWLGVVPFGVLACANAFNMSAGYNGLESGIACITSASMIIVLSLKSSYDSSMIIYFGLLGSAVALYIFNKCPSNVFVGDVGTLGFGATFAAASIIGKISFYGLIAILPAFYELFATIYYFSKRVERRDACMNPVLLDDGKIKSPPGAEYYTLAYFLLSIKPMSERELVRNILFLYIICGLSAVAICLISV